MSDRGTRSSPRLLRGFSENRSAWVLSVLIHVVLVAALQLGPGPAASKTEPLPDIKVVEAVLMDSRELRERREQHAEALAAIERKKREAAEKKEAEARKKREAAEKKKAEARKAKEKKDRAAKKKKEEAERKRKEAKAKKEEKQRDAQRKKEQAERERVEAAIAAERAKRQAEADARHREQLAARASREARQLTAWAARIRTHIKQSWNAPAGAPNAPCEVVVEQNKQGYVQSVAIRKCNARAAWQKSLRRAVQQASPLPRPPHPSLMQERLVIVFHPSGD